MLEINIWTLLFAILLVFDIVSKCWKHKRVNGIFQIDEYTDKDYYRMLWLTPLGELKNNKHLYLEVRVERHPEESIDPSWDDDISQHLHSL